MGFDGRGGGAWKDCAGVLRGRLGLKLLLRTLERRGGESSESSDKVGSGWERDFN